MGVKDLVWVRDKRRFWKPQGGLCSSQVSLWLTAVSRRLIQFQLQLSPTQWTFVPAVQTDDGQEDDGDEDGGRHEEKEPGEVHGLSERERRRSQVRS